MRRTLPLAAILLLPALVFAPVTAPAEEEAAAPPRPSIPRHYPHIRVGALAYAGNPMGTFEQKLLRESIDLVIPTPKLLPACKKAGPNVPSLIYANVSNLYQELLLDWLDYAHRNGHDREAAFFHVAEPTPFTGASSSSWPVAWFREVWKEESVGREVRRQRLTGDAHEGKAGVTLPGAGYVYLGTADPFREVRFDLTRPAASGWSVTWQYATADGWRELKPTDGTAGLTASGSVTFDPPADWKPTAYHTAPRMWYVRMRCEGAGRSSPVAKTILGRDYVNWDGKSKGTVPVFDASADANGDGYLTDAEYAKRAAGKDARFRYESRLPHPNYGPNRFGTRLADTSVRAWLADYHKRYVAAEPLCDGLFVDNTGGKAPIEKAKVLEDERTYADDHAAALRAVGSAIAPRWLLCNAGGHGKEIATVLKASPAAMEEFAIRAVAHHHGQFEDVSALVTERLAATDMLVLDSLPAGGKPDDGRTQLATLAYYYLLADPDRTMLMFFGGAEPASPWVRHWSPAAAVDVGRPKEKWRQRDKGTDPADAGLEWRLFERAYTKALVLYKPLSYSRGKRPGGVGDETATEHALGGRYRPVRADGTLGEAVEKVRLRNGEGAILLREP